MNWNQGAGITICHVSSELCPSVLEPYLRISMKYIFLLQRVVRLSLQICGAKVEKREFYQIYLRAVG